MSRLDTARLGDVRLQLRGGPLLAPDPYDDLLEELVAAIELRECGDPDVRDWTVERRIRNLERTLLEQHRLGAGVRGRLAGMRPEEDPGRLAPSAS